MKRKGFTLIELLVVIAIIAILAAILFPVFAKAREKARQASCLSNLKQMALASHMYAQDYDETMPTANFGGMWATQQATDYGWCYILPMIQPYIKNWQVFGCPSATPNMQGPASNKINVSYGYNEYLYDQGRGWSTLAAMGGVNGVTQVVLFADSRFPGIFNDWDTNDGTGKDSNPLNYLNRVALAANTTPRHDGSIFAFADGHAKYLPLGKIRCPAGSGTAGEYPIVNPAAAILP